MGLSDALSIIAIILSLVAIVQTALSEKRSRENNKDTGNLLSEIRIKAEVLEALASQNQGKLLDTVTAIANPQKPDIEDQMKFEMAKGIFQNPGALTDLLKNIKNIQGLTSQLGSSPEPPETPEE
jgi:hypothetical protein